MSQFTKAVVGLTSAIFLVTSLYAQVATSGVTNPGALLLAQKAEQEKAPVPSPEPPPQKPELPKSMERPQPQLEEMQRKSRSLGSMSDDPAHAGTKKIGGQVIRAKETTQGE